MKLLILGGTVFLGRALVDAALAAGHQVTLFNRGKTNPGLFDGVEQIHGDRKEGLPGLAGRTWDAVIDTSGYLPAVVRASAQALSGAAGHYTFISSISVYADFQQRGMDEDSPVGRLEDETVTEITNETYGPLKALCEQEVQAALPGRALVIRPGLIVGPHDPSDRFTYWPYRVAQGGEVLVPGRPEHSVQFVDVRDLAGWNLRLVEQGQTGLYNATGPEQPLPMGALMESCQAAAGSRSNFTWVDEQFLLDQQVQPWTDLPLWLPELNPEHAGMDAVSIQRALAAGLTFRPVVDTCRDTLAWANTRPPERPWRMGISREREAELLTAWHSRS